MNLLAAGIGIGLLVMGIFTLWLVGRMQKKEEKRWREEYGHSIERFRKRHLETVE